MSELGHEPTFTTPLRSVWNAPLNRHSAPSVGNAAVGRPTRLKAVGLACANLRHSLVHAPEMKFSVCYIETLCDRKEN